MICERLKMKIAFRLLGIQRKKSSPVKSFFLYLAFIRIFFHFNHQYLKDLAKMKTQTSFSLLLILTFTMWNKISNCFWNVYFQAFRSKVDCSYPSQLKPLKPQLGLNEALYRKWWCKSLLQSLWQKFKTINTLSGHKQNVQTEMWNGKCDDVFALRIQNIRKYKNSK